MIRVAWLVEVNDCRCVVFSPTRARAKWIAVQAYWDAYGRRGWPQVKTARAERYDSSQLRDDVKPGPWIEEFVASYHCHRVAE